MQLTDAMFFGGRWKNRIQIERCRPHRLLGGQQATGQDAFPVTRWRPPGLNWSRLPC